MITNILTHFLNTLLTPLVKLIMFNPTATYNNYNLNKAIIIIYDNICLDLHTYMILFVHHSFCILHCPYGILFLMYKVYYLEFLLLLLSWSELLVLLLQMYFTLNFK